MLSTVGKYFVFTLILLSLFSLFFSCKNSSGGGGTQNQNKDPKSGLGPSSQITTGSFQTDPGQTGSSVRSGVGLLVGYKVAHGTSQNKQTVTCSDDITYEHDNTLPLGNSNGKEIYDLDSPNKQWKVFKSNERIEKIFIPTSSPSDSKIALYSNSSTCRKSKDWMYIVFESNNGLPGKPTGQIYIVQLPTE